MDSHSLVEPIADRGGLESVVQTVCVYVCVFEQACMQGRGANWLTEWLGDCEEATAIRPALIEFDASLNSFQMEEQVLFFRSNPHCPDVCEDKVHWVVCEGVGTHAQIRTNSGSCVCFMLLQLFLLFLSEIESILHLLHHACIDFTY